MQAVQLQHSSIVADKKLSLVYGADLFMTRPSGNVYGRFEGQSNINQYAGYLQGKYKFDKKSDNSILESSIKTVNRQGCVFP